MINFRTLRPTEIDIRVGQVFKSEYREGATLLLYKNARVDMDILDDTVGAENWQRSQVEIKGNLYCNVSIFDKDKSEWTTKQDCGVESNTEAEKGEASDAFKRACVNWGIGRELYRAPKIFIKWDVEQVEKNGKKQLVLKYNPSFYVKSISYSDTREITQLTIEAVSGGTKRIVFDWTAGDEPKQPQSTPQLTNTQPQQNMPQSPNSGSIDDVQMTLAEAEKYCFTTGKHANVPFKEISERNLKWIFEESKCPPKTKKAAKLVYESMQRTKVRNDGSQLQMTELTPEEKGQLPF